MVKPESRRGSLSGYSLPTMVDTFGLNRPLPAMIVARPILNTSWFGIAIRNRPTDMNTAPISSERW